MSTTHYIGAAKVEDMEALYSKTELLVSFHEELDEVVNQKVDEEVRALLYLIVLGTLVVVLSIMKTPVLLTISMLLSLVVPLVSWAMAVKNHKKRRSNLLEKYTKAQEEASLEEFETRDVHREHQWLDSYARLRALDFVAETYGTYAIHELDSPMVESERLPYEQRIIKDWLFEAGGQKFQVSVSRDPGISHYVVYSLNEETGEVNVSSRRIQLNPSNKTIEQTEHKKNM